MTEGGGGHGDQYRDQYGDQSYPPAPPPPWDPAAPSQPDRPDQPQDQPGGSRAAAPGQPGQPPQDQGATPTQAFSDRAPSGEYPAAPPPYGQQQYGGQYGQPAQGQQYGQYPPAGHQQDPYAQPYGQNPYGQAPWAGGPPGFGGAPADYASWGQRAAALLLDILFAILVYLPGVIVLIVAFATADTTTEPDGTTTIDNVNGGLVAVGVALMVAAFVWQIWNQGWRQGSQGWSWGKQVVGIKLVGEATRQPPGGWTGIGRALVRGLLGGITGNIYTVLTYLWPLWDEKNQTLDDKIWSTLVVRAR